MMPDVDNPGCDTDDVSAQHSPHRKRFNLFAPCAARGKSGGLQEPTCACTRSLRRGPLLARHHSEVGSLAV